jgi:predicted aminopeptidase
MTGAAARLATLVVAATLAGCQAGYYAHLIQGHYELLSRREPIAQVVARPGIDPLLKKSLERAIDARSFASRVLGLPDNGSYTSYADLGRPYAVWNVFAAPEFSLSPHEWCYAFAGCYAYRGFYDVEAARREAEQLRAAGLDVHVGGVPAYSTVGWFDDPVLNTILGAEDALAGTLFHELAHQQHFVKGDTAFNESFATFVEHEGLQEYLRESPELRAAARRRQQRYGQFVELVLLSRRRLEALYAAAQPADEMRRAKAAEFERLRQGYAMLKQSWGGDGSYDGWIASDLNNARLLPFGLYHEWVPSFATLFRQVEGNWAAFYGAVGEIAKLDDAERRQKLLELKTS